GWAAGSSITSCGHTSRTPGQNLTGDHGAGVRTGRAARATSEASPPRLGVFVNILIVESNAKAKTIQRYLGKEWTVLATGGHVQELPSSADDRKEGKKAYWSNRPGELPKPPWSWTPNGEKALRAIRAAAAKDGDPKFFLATDPDREGEFIAWRLAELLTDAGPTRRVTFQEVTREAVLEAIANARDIDMDLVQSAMVRRFLD